MARPEFITLNPDISADLSRVDVTKGTEVKQEVAIWERSFGIGYAAVVTCKQVSSLEYGTFSDKVRTTVLGVLT